MNSVARLQSEGKVKDVGFRWLSTAVPTAECCVELYKGAEPHSAETTFPRQSDGSAPGTRRSLRGCGLERQRFRDTRGTWCSLRTQRTVGGEERQRKLRYLNPSTPLSRYRRATCRTGSTRSEEAAHLTDVVCHLLDMVDRPQAGPHLLDDPIS